MNYFIFNVVYFMPWIMLGMSLIILGSFLYYIIFKNKNDIDYYLHSLFNLYGKYLIFNLIVSLVMLSVRLNMELIIGYSIIYIGIFFLLNLFSYLIMEFNFFKFQSSNYLGNDEIKKIIFYINSRSIYKNIFHDNNDYE